MTTREHLEELKKILNIQEYHDASFKGQGIIVASVESLTSDHGSNVCDTVLTYAPEAKVISFNDEFEDKSATGDNNVTVTFPEFVDWCIEHKVDIITSSLDWSCDKEEEQKAIKKLYDNGIIFLNSAGNSGSEIKRNDTIKKPKDFDNEVVTVSGFMHDVKGRFSWSNFNYGEAVDVVGCGSNCPTLSRKDGSCYSWSGTSSATPMIAGMLATYKSANKKLNSKNVFDLINNNYIPLMYKECEYKILTLPPIELIEMEDNMEDEKAKYNNPSDWSFDSWKKATDKGITDGTNPQGILTREQLIVILDRLKLI